MAILISVLLIASIAGSADANGFEDHTVYVDPENTRTNHISLDGDNDKDTKYHIHAELDKKDQDVSAEIKDNGVLGEKTCDDVKNIDADVAIKKGEHKDIDIEIHRQNKEGDEKIHCTIKKDNENDGHEDSCEVKCTHKIPEFPNVAFPVAGLLGLVFIFGRKKEGL